MTSLTCPIKLAILQRKNAKVKEQPETIKQLTNFEIYKLSGSMYTPTSKDKQKE